MSTCTFESVVEYISDLVARNGADPSAIADAVRNASREHLELYGNTPDGKNATHYHGFLLGRLKGLETSAE